MAPTSQFPVGSHRKNRKIKGQNGQRLSGRYDTAPPPFMPSPRRTPEVLTLAQRLKRRTEKGQYPMFNDSSTSRLPVTSPDGTESESSGSDYSEFDTPRRTTVNGATLAEGTSRLFISTSPDSPLSSETWEQYTSHFTAVDDKFMTTWDKDLDTLLLFAALFSAVVTAFVIESYQSIKPDAITSTALLQQILVAVQSNGNSSAAVSALQLSTKPSSTAVRVNALWFASLVTSVSTAFLVILSKEWLADLNEGRKDPSAELHTKGRQIQFRYDSMQDWNLSLVLPFLPLLLHVSLLLFFAGLVDFLWDINSTVGIVSAVLVCAMAVIYVWTHVRSIFSATCPYRTSLTSLILTLVNALQKKLSFDIPAAVAQTWVFMAVLYEYGRHNRDSEVFHAIWDVMVVSWFTGHSISIRGTLQDSQLLPKNLARLWTKHSALGPTNVMRLREEAYISDHPDLMDARVLARMIGMHPRVMDSAQLIDELCKFPALVRHRALFIDAGAIDLLVNRVCQIYKPSNGSISTPGKDRMEASQPLWALARLLTEAEMKDTRTVVLSFQGIPVLWDFRLRRVPGYIPYRYHPEKSLTDSQLCQPDARLDHQSLDDIVLFSHMLRLQLVASSPEWYSHPIQESVDAFYERLLQSRSCCESLSDDDLTALVNTVIFVGMRPVKLIRTAVKRETSEVDLEGQQPDPDGEERELQEKHTAKSLDALTAMMKNRPDMGFSVLRQICWGIWMLSGPTPRSLSGLLVPDVRSIDALAPALAKLLAPKWENDSQLDAVFVLMEVLLKGASNKDQPDSEAREQLLEELMDQYPQFLTRMRTMFRPTIVARLSNMLPFDTGLAIGIDSQQEVESATLLKSLRHVVQISGFESSAMNDKGGVKILSLTLKVLRKVCSRLEHVKSTDERDLQTLAAMAFDFACKVAKFRFREEGSSIDFSSMGSWDFQGSSESGGILKLAEDVAWALRSACEEIARDEKDTTLEQRIASTLFVALAKLQEGELDDVHLGELAKEMLGHLKTCHLEKAIDDVQHWFRRPKDCVDAALEAISAPPDAIHAPPNGCDSEGMGKDAAALRS